MWEMLLDLNKWKKKTLIWPKNQTLIIHSYFTMEDERRHISDKDDTWEILVFTYWILQSLWTTPKVSVDSDVYKPKLYPTISRFDKH